jgi:hypothetical protein
MRETDQAFVVLTEKKLSAINKGLQAAYTKSQILEKRILRLRDRGEVLVQALRVLNPSVAYALAGQLGLTSAPAVPPAEQPFDPAKLRMEFFHPDWLDEFYKIDFTTQEDEYLIHFYSKTIEPPPYCMSPVDDPKNPMKKILSPEWRTEREEAVQLLARRREQYDRWKAFQAERLNPAADVPEGNVGVPPEVLALSRGKDIA